MQYDKKTEATCFYLQYVCCIAAIVIKRQWRAQQGWQKGSK